MAGKSRITSSWLVGRRIAVKLDKRVSNLEAKGGGAVSIKSHIIGVGKARRKKKPRTPTGGIASGQMIWSSF